MSNMHSFPIGGMKKQHDAILETFGTTEGIIYSLTRLQSTSCFFLSSFRSYSQNLELFSSPGPSQPSKLS